MYGVLGDVAEQNAILQKCRLQYSLHALCFWMLQIMCFLRLDVCVGSSTSVHILKASKSAYILNKCCIPGGGIVYQQQDIWSI